MHILKSNFKLCFACIVCSPLMGANIVFDLHGVLINVSHISCMRQLPITAVAQYIALDAPSFKGIQKDWFSFLDMLDDQKPSVDSYDPSGIKVPNIMTHNLTGLRSCADVCSRADYLCSTNNKYFRSEAHRIFMLGLTRAIFTPSSFVRSISWFNDMIDLVIDYKRLGHKVFILSNLNDEHFAALKARYPFHIDFFDGVVISGLVHRAKPDHAIYENILNTYQLNPKETLFIDDQAVNCQAAEACGINSILCPQKRSWLNLWRVQPDVEQVRRLINLTLYRQGQLPA
jgi:FMN phosphatase YigB (HAD superfamily)